MTAFIIVVVNVYFFYGDHPDGQQAVHFIVICALKHMILSKTYGNAYYARYIV